ncbi:hypothetical protein Tco_1478576, partial [Tanacetum coccineum]
MNITSCRNTLEHFIPNRKDLRTVVSSKEISFSISTVMSTTVGAVGIKRPLSVVKVTTAGYDFYCR